MKVNTLFNFTFADSFLFSFFFFKSIWLCILENNSRIRKIIEWRINIVYYRLWEERKKKRSKDSWSLTAIKLITLLSFQAKLETKALKAKRPGFTDERYNETSYYVENGENLCICKNSLIVLSAINRRWFTIDRPVANRYNYLVIRYD